VTPDLALVRVAARIDLAFPHTAHGNLCRSAVAFFPNRPFAVQTPSKMLAEKRTTMEEKPTSIRQTLLGSIISRHSPQKGFNYWSAPTTYIAPACRF
jgi:hypothetical protein